MLKAVGSAQSITYAQNLYKAGAIAYELTGRFPNVAAPE